MSQMKKLQILGLCGVARCGKDSFYAVIDPYLRSRGYEPLRFSFADALKDDVYDFLQEKTGINSFTETTSEKDLIRDFLVSYGSHLMRKINPRYWIEKVESEVRVRMRAGALPVFTDVRYLNELEWIKDELGGNVIHITREGTGPANNEEALNDPPLHQKANLKFKWRNFEGEPAANFLSNETFNAFYQLLAR